MERLLPAGLKLNPATHGFTNIGQFLAAAHVSHNLGISFTALQKEITGRHATSLGQAIHKLAPTANVATSIRTAQFQANRDLSSLNARDDRSHNAKNEWNFFGGQHDQVARETTSNSGWNNQSR